MTEFEINFRLHCPDPMRFQKAVRAFIALAAYQYEIYGKSIFTDQEYDEIARLVDVKIDTDRPELDEFFRRNYTPISGMWVHNHPELEKLKRITLRQFPNAEPKQSIQEEPELTFEEEELTL